MTASLRALLAGIVDYAGLFPPAKLPLQEAMRNYARYRQEPESWMLGRFVCPAARLAELTPFAEELFPQGPPLTFSALGRGGNTVPAFLAELDADLRAISNFQDRHRGRVTVDVMEVRLPTDVVHPHQGEGLRQLLDRIPGHVSRSGLSALALYYEVPPGPEWRAAVLNVLDRFSAGTRRPGGLKLRCGGLEPAAFPSPEQVAFTIMACLDGKVPVKFTAGLHHPLRHFDPDLQTPIHGFLNVFGAGVLAHAQRLPEQAVRQILVDEDPANFVFDDEGFRWKDLNASTDEILTARREAVISFGSCSFDEPRADLRALGFL